MKILFTSIFLVVTFFIQAQPARLIVLTDIGQDPDDQQSMVRLLHYANEFQIEGLIATADNNSKKEAPEIRDDIIHKLINDYETCFSNFNIHSKGFPEAEELRKTVKKGNNKGGTKVPVKEFIGEGFDTEGSDWIISVVDQPNPQPVCISVWGGACDLAQALWKIKNTRSQKKVADFVKKLRVYFIANQDASNQWIIDNFPDLWLILSLDRSGNTWLSSFRGMFWGGDMSNTTKEWIHKNIYGHSPLADNYPDKAWTGGKGRNPHMALKEGDTPAMLYFMQNGLNDIEHPEWGGWGGRFTEDKPNFFRDTNDSCYDISEGKVIHSPRATIFRWRNDFQNDFAARIDWGSASDYAAANHPPEIVMNGSSSKEVVVLKVTPGMQIKLDATQTRDPDRDKIEFSLFEYFDAGNCPAKIKFEANSKGDINISVPEGTTGTEAHVILKVADDGKPSLSCTKRIVLQIQ